MDPLTLGIAAVGVGLQLFGGASASAHAKEAYGIQQNITGLEGQVNNQRHEAMELSARRQSMEIFRNSQRARAQAVNNATNQGANYGNSSGLPGGLAQVADQSMFNLQGINQNLELGRNIFGLDDQISKQKLALSGVQSSMVTDQGISQLGSSIAGNAGTLGKVGQYGYSQLGSSFGSSKTFNNLGSGFDI